MAITPDLLATTDEGIARRVLVRARQIAPCLDSLTGQSRLDAIAILDGLIAELPAVGEGRIKSMSRNGTSLTFEIGSAFTSDVRASLASLCTAATVPGLPRGSFPAPLPLSRQWAEGEYT